MQLRLVGRRCVGAIECCPMTCGGFGGILKHKSVIGKASTDPVMYDVRHIHGVPAAAAGTRCGNSGFVGAIIRRLVVPCKGAGTPGESTAVGGDGGLRTGDLLQIKGCTYKIIPGDGGGNIECDITPVESS